MRGWIRYVSLRCRKDPAFRWEKKGEGRFDSRVGEASDLVISFSDRNLDRVIVSSIIPLSDVMEISHQIGAGRDFRMERAELCIDSIILSSMI